MKVLQIAAVVLFTFPAQAMADPALPVDGVVTSGVGWRTDPFGSGKVAFHRGIDIAVPVGTPVRATRKGRVLFAGERRGYGATVIVEHANGDRTLYGHNASVKVSAGEQVEAGAVLSYSGNSGRSTGPHVHYELLAGGRPAVDEVAALDLAEDKPAATGNERRLLEQRMDQSLDSLLTTIRSDLTGG